VGRNTVIGCGLAVALLVLLGRFRQSPLEQPTTDDQQAAFRVGSASGKPRMMSGMVRSEPAEAVGARISRLLGDSVNRDEFALNSQEIADLLARNQTNAPSLLAAFEASRDKEFLKKAAEQFPDDPFVQTKVLFHDLYPERRQEWIDALKKTSPQNSLPHFLVAQELMKKGDLSGVLQEIQAGRNKKYEDYTGETMAGLEEAYLMAGRSTAEAKALGSAEVLLPQLAPFKKMVAEMADLAVQYGKSGDRKSQTALLEGAWVVGSQFRSSSENGPLLHGLVGLAMENITLQRWPEGTPAPFLDKPVAEQITENRAFRTDVRLGTTTFGQWLPSAPENEIIVYYDRLRNSGELNAINWLKRQHPEFVPIGLPTP
jgi:hypothetical protein